jgi:hypothetical protein
MAGGRTAEQQNNGTIERANNGAMEQRNNSRKPDQGTTTDSNRNNRTIEQWHGATINGTDRQPGTTGIVAQHNQSVEQNMNKIRTTRSK